MEGLGVMVGRLSLESYPATCCSPPQLQRRNDAQVSIFLFGATPSENPNKNRGAA